MIYKMSVPYGNPSNISYVFQEPAILGLKKKPLTTGRQDEYGCTPDKNIHVIISGEIINREDIIDIRKEKLTQKSGDAKIIACLFEE